MPAPSSSSEPGHKGSPGYGDVPYLNPVKLRPPSVSHRLVAHDRLVALRPDPGHVPIVEVVAPAGYGKTAVLAEWAEHDTRPWLWVTLDVHDDDPLVLVAHLAQAALDAGAPPSGLPEAILNPAGEVWSVLMPRLSVALQGLGSYSLMLDDTHAVSSPSSRDVIEWLALHVPSGSQVILGGRSSCCPRSSRRLVDGQLVRVGTPELRLSDDEAFELLLARGLDIPSAASAGINRWCEGWPSGLLMASMPAPDGGGYSTSMDEFHQKALIDDYIRSEVLAGLAPEEQDFLRRTSVLRVMSGPLCDAVLEGTRSEAALEHLSAANAFVATLADGSCVMHELLRVALLRGLEEEDPALTSELRSRAAMWFSDHGNPEEAVHFAQESGRSELAIQLVSSFGVAEFSRGRQVTLMGWYDWAESAGVADTEPSLAAAGSLFSALSGEPKRSERWAARLARASSNSSVRDRDPLADGLNASVAAWQCRRGAAEALVDALRAIELVPGDSPWRFTALGAYATACLMDGRRAEATDALTSIVADDGPASVDANGHSTAAVFLARQAIEDHDLSTARHWLEFSSGIRRAGHMTEQGLQSFEDAVGGRLAVLEGADVGRAKQLLAHAQPLRSLTTWAMPGLALPARLELVKAHLLLGDLAAPRVLMREIRVILQHRPGLGAFEAEANELADPVSRLAESASGPSALTSAELRLIPWLATHLSFREIGERLFLSTNTVKTEALSAYRKLGVSSRSDAVEAAVLAGLLDPASLPGILRASYVTTLAS